MSGAQDKLTVSLLEAAEEIRARAATSADLGKLTLPIYVEVIYVKDCECTGRQRCTLGAPTCEECGKAWTRTYGPSNDAPVEVQIEIRAAELAYRPLYAYTDDEWSGWTDFDLDHEDIPPEAVGNWAGWLSAAIEDHDQEWARDGQRDAVKALVDAGLA